MPSKPHPAGSSRSTRVLIVVCAVVILAAVIAAVVWARVGSPDRARQELEQEHGRVVSEFEVPSSTWEPGDDAMDALISGSVVIDPDTGCTTLSDGKGTAGLVLPYATGVEFENGTRGLVNSKNGKLYAIEGQEISIGGGGFTADHKDWAQQCGDMEIDDVSVAHGWPES